MSGWQEKLWKRVLITNGIERAEYASRTPVVEMSLFQELQVQHQMVLYEMLLEYRKQKENTLYKQNLLY